jgi:hypothetical protein
VAYFAAAHALSVDRVSQGADGLKDLPASSVIVRELG